jgi:uncharacterized protein YbjT (DUF2867 family)
MILVTTAGKVGAETARLLAQRREPVRILVRDPDKATALAQAGAEAAQGDLEDPATIATRRCKASRPWCLSAPRSPHAGKTYWPTGPEAITFSDAAAVLSRLLGRPVTFHPLTVEERTRAMVDIGLPKASPPPSPPQQKESS